LRALACALLLCALPAQAYVRTRNGAGVCVWWSAHGHSFQVDALGTPDVSGAAAADAVRRSFATWGAVSCSDLTFPEQPISTSATDRLVGYFQSGTNHNLVLFRSNACRDVVPNGTTCTGAGGCSNLYDCWDQGDGVIASTTTTSNARTGEILDSDIELNAATFRFTAVDGLPCQGATETGCVRTDVQNTVTHEAGHSLGLDHPPDHPEATMYATGPPGETTKRVLAQDDTQGICSIYPRGAASMTCTGPAPGGGGGCGCSASQTGPGATLVALLVLLQIRRRSRRTPQLAMSSSTAKAIAPRFQRGKLN
jgi:MYXO-CTERM domain-containing protein